MTRLLSMLLLPAFLAACGATPRTQAGSSVQTNAAATFCTRSGGRVIPKQTAAGPEGWCQLPSGLLVEEWAFYDQAHPAKGS